MPAPSPCSGSAPVAPRCARFLRMCSALRDDRVRFAVLDVGNEADAAGVVLVARVVHALGSWGPEAVLRGPGSRALPSCPPSRRKGNPLERPRVPSFSCAKQPRSAGACRESHRAARAGRSPENCRDKGAVRRRGETKSWYPRCCNAATAGRLRARLQQEPPDGGFFQPARLAPQAFLGFNLNKLGYLFVAASNSSLRTSLRTSSSGINTCSNHPSPPGFARCLPSLR